MLEKKFRLLLKGGVLGVIVMPIMNFRVSLGIFSLILAEIIWSLRWRILKTMLKLKFFQIN